MRPRYGVVVLACACAPARPLDQVPILGGSATQESTIRGALVFFEHEAGGGRVQLRRINVTEPVVVGASGGFDPRRREIYVDRSLSGSLLEGVVLHELCHALDAAEDITETRPESFAALAEARISPSELYPDHDDRVGEAFAQLCGLGRLGLQLATRCDTDPALHGAAAVVTDTVWLVAPAEPVQVSAPTLASWHQRFAAQDPSYHSSSAPGAFNLYVTDLSSDARVSLTLDVATGAELPVAADAPPGAGSPLPLGFVGRGAGWMDGPALAEGFFPSLFTAPGGLIGWNGAEWAPAAPECAAGHPFLVGNEIWLGDDDLQWGPTGMTR